VQVSLNSLLTLAGAKFHIDVNTDQLTDQQRVIQAGRRNARQAEELQELVSNWISMSHQPPSLTSEGGTVKKMSIYN